MADYYVVVLCKKNLLLRIKVLLYPAWKWPEVSKIYIYQKASNCKIIFLLNCMKFHVRAQIHQTESCSCQFDKRFDFIRCIVCVTLMLWRYRSIKSNQAKVHNLCQECNFPKYETIQSFICGKYLMEIWNLSKIVHVDLEVSYNHIHFKLMKYFTILTYMNIDIVQLCF